MYQTNFTQFFHLAFRALNPNRPYYPSWAAEVLGHALARCVRRECRRLIVNLPPRNLKSIAASVALPAWILAHEPYSKVICVGGSRGLVDAQHVLTRSLLTHARYRALFPHVKITEKGKGFYLDHGGSRLGVTPTAAITGRGADFIIIDDPVSATAVHNGNLCNPVNRWYDENIHQRLDDKARGVVIVVMQRLHVNDLTAHLLKQGGWEHLCLPAIAEDDWRYARLFGARILRCKGDALQPQVENREQLRAGMLAMGPVTFMAQYQQRPYAEGEGVSRYRWYSPLRVGTPAPLDLDDASWEDSGFTYIEEEKILLHTVFGEGQHPWPPDMRDATPEEAELLLDRLNTRYLETRAQRADI